MDNHAEKVSLTGQAAVDLWLAGATVWNRWVRQNPVAEVSFEDIDFSNYSVDDNALSFEGFEFPTGKVTFNHARFGDGSVYFDNATFGDGNVSFEAVSFGKGDVFFNNATFGDGYVSFKHASFGDGTISFNRVIFGDGDVSFNDAVFGKGKLNIDNATFKGRVDFSNLQQTQNLTEFSLHNSSFEKSLNLSGNHFNCVIDLKNTKLAHQFSLDGLRCNYLKTGWLGKAKDSHDIARLRRLKQIAEGNKFHEQALRIKADEMRAKRGHETTFSTGLVFDLLFDWMACYGQSIVRPMIILMIITALFGGIYYSKIPACAAKESQKEAVFLASSLAAAQVFPFVPNSRDLRRQSVNDLYACNNAVNPTYNPYLLIEIQSVLSFVCLFMIGLGLRHRFRI